MAERGGSLSLICRAGDALCALPLVHIVETMRPLPVEPVDGAPAAVAGVTIIRGEPVPVVTIGRQAARFVVVRVRERRIALGVDDVVGIREIPADAARDLPPLLSRASDALTRIGALDGDLLLVLDAARILPEDALERIARKAKAS